MKLNENLDDLDDYCSTTHAAKLMGVSVATVQVMVERNELKAWKTRGGHRRISKTSVNAFMRKQGMPFPSMSEVTNALRVLLVEDDPVTREMLSGFCTRSPVQVDCTIMSSALEALVDISGLKPDLLITDLAMPGVDGFELLKILNEDPQFKQMTILVLSALLPAEIKSRGGLPDGVIFMPKPISAAWFHGFLTALASSKLML